MLNSIADKIIFLLFVILNLVIIKSPLFFYLMELPRLIKIFLCLIAECENKLARFSLPFRLLTTSRLVTLNYLISTLFLSNFIKKNDRFQYLLLTNCNSIVFRIWCLAFCNIKEILRSLTSYFQMPKSNYQIQLYKFYNIISQNSFLLIYYYR